MTDHTEHPNGPIGRRAYAFADAAKRAAPDSEAATQAGLMADEADRAEQRGDHDAATKALSTTRHLATEVQRRVAVINTTEENAKAADQHARAAERAAEIAENVWQIAVDRGDNTKYQDLLGSLAHKAEEAAREASDAACEAEDAHIRGDATTCAEALAIAEEARERAESAAQGAMK